MVTMSNRRKPRNERSRHSKTPPLGMPIGPEADFVMSRTARQACDQCQAPVKWVGAEEAKAHGMDVTEALGFLGVSSAEGLDIWICTRCDNGGVMGKAEGGWL